MYEKKQQRKQEPKYLSIEKSGCYSFRLECVVARSFEFVSDMENIIIRDKRKTGWFTIDNEAVDEMGGAIGLGALGVYVAILRHADLTSGKCFPSQKMLAKKCGITDRSVIKHVATLEKHRMIHVDRLFSKETNRRAPNIYYILDKSQWVKKPGENISHGEPGEKFAQSRVKNFHYKETKYNKTKDDELRSSLLTGSTEVNLPTEVNLNSDGELVEKEVRKVSPGNPKTKELYKTFREMAEKHVGHKPVYEPGKAGKRINAALETLSEKEILDLFDWWFTEPHPNKEDADLLQITQALSGYSISRYKTNYGK